jgi:aryl-alcohol dehydrogenase-like predicted oxidoreductase
MNAWLNNKVKLGKTSIEVPRLCLGTMTWGEQNTQEQAHEQLDYALANGLNFIDTAEMYSIPVKAQTYSATETIIGPWLKKQTRDKIILASKIAGPGRGMAWVRTPERAADGDLSKKDITLACEASLKRLQTDYLDLYQIHWPARYTPIFGDGVYDVKKERDCVSMTEQLEAMESLIKAGKIRAWGVSNETAWGVSEFSNLAKRLAVTPPATIQNVYSLLSREFDTALVETCHHEKVSLLGYSPLAFGYLTGKYRAQQKPTGARLTLFGGIWPRYSKPEIHVAVEEYATLAQSRGLSLLQLAMGFVLARPMMASSIIGATSLAQLKETIAAADTVIDQPLLEAIDAIQRRMTNPIA